MYILIFKWGCNQNDLPYLLLILSHNNKILFICQNHCWQQNNLYIKAILLFRNATLQTLAISCISQRKTRCKMFIQVCYIPSQKLLKSIHFCVHHCSELILFTFASSQMAWYQLALSTCRIIRTQQMKDCSIFQNKKLKQNYLMETDLDTSFDYREVILKFTK